ncbi:cholesterol 7alpha-monooxygenase [Microdochium nivale]|nr:cholesterol 7alpha-monooxygenase [Microdochium nivale]
MSTVAAAATASLCSSTLGRPLLVIVALAACVLGLCALTYAATTLRYYVALYRIRTSSCPDVRSPIVPYATPWLGHSLAFLTPHPGRFYRDVLCSRAYPPPPEGFFAIVLAGEVHHIVYSARAVAALFKVKSTVAHREHLTHDIFIKTLRVSEDDYARMAHGGGLAMAHRDEEMNQELLLRQGAVNELTSTYVAFLKAELVGYCNKTAAGSKEGGNTEVLDLYAWLQEHMFPPSVKAFLGDRMGAIYAGFAADFWIFENGMLNMLFGIPRMINPRPYDVRDRLIENITSWVKQGDELLAASGKNDKPDPHNPATEWEPVWGSRLSRARQARWISEGVTKQGRASMELGFVFGLSSNVIPATGWMLMHILDPKDPALLPRVLNELRRAVISDGTGSRTTLDNLELDINALIAQPLLMSIYQEVMRRYVDVLVARKAEQDVRLPLDLATSEGKPQMLLVRKGETIITPNIVSQGDPAFFANPPPDVFDPERFLVPATNSASQESGAGADNNKNNNNKWQDEYAFSTASSAHKFWPYGGGKTICPGRVFAKQEILATVAMVLLGFDVEPVMEAEKWQIPGFASVYGGSGTIPPGGDVRVRMRARRG